MGGLTGNAVAQDIVNYKTVHNNTAKNWWQDKGLRKNVFYCIGLCGTLFFNGYDGSLFNGLQTIDSWQAYFGHPKGNTLGLMNSAALFPGLIAPVVAERIAHRFGRRYAVWIGTWINIVGAVVNSAAINLGMYIAGRAIMGFGISMGLTIAPTLLQEFAHPRYRAPLGTMYTSIYYIAAVISAAVCLGTRHIDSNWAWRVPCYLQLVGPLVTFGMTVTMPESPRWLVKHDRLEEAVQILAEYHANGDKDDPLVQLEVTEIVGGIESEVNDKQVLIIAIGTNWVGNGIISYYLSPILNQIGVTSTNQQAGLNLGLQIWNLILSTTAGLNCDRIGRRPLWLASNIGMLCTFVIVMGLSGSYAANHERVVGLAVIPFLFIFFGFYDISWTPLANMYTVEILPYNLRAKGQAIYNITQGLANALNQWVNPIILDAIQWKYYAVYIGILSAYVVIIWFKFPETKNLTMEEISMVFDGSHADKIKNVAVKANTIGRLDGSEDLVVTDAKSRVQKASGGVGETNHIEEV